MAEKFVVFKPQQPYDPKSNTPYQQQKEYSQTWLEFAAQKYQQILERASSTSAAVTIYSVPANSTLFITSANLAWAADTSGTFASGIIKIVSGSSSAQIILDCHGLSGSGFLSLSVSGSYPMPLKVSSGTTIELTGGSVGSASRGSIQGFLVPFIV